MKVITHAPHSWFLYEEDDSLYLDVNCSNGPVGFSVLLRLTAPEKDHFLTHGPASIESLAASIRAEADSIEHPRNLDPQWHTKAVRAAAEWQSNRGADVAGASPHLPGAAV